MAQFIFSSCPSPLCGSFWVVGEAYLEENKCFPFRSPWVTFTRMQLFASSIDDAEVQTVTFLNIKRGAEGSC